MRIFLFLTLSLLVWGCSTVEVTKEVIKVTNTVTDKVKESIPKKEIEEGTVIEEIIEENENIYSNQSLKEKKSSTLLKSSQAILIGLDKITAKSSELIINLNESKQFGQLEIKILKCGQVKVDNMIDSVAYMQVKDLTKNNNEQVFIFNGWTFASDPSLTPFDHAIYDLQLLNCNKA